MNKLVKINRLPGDRIDFYLTSGKVLKYRITEEAKDKVFLHGLCGIGNHSIFSELSIYAYDLYKKLGIFVEEGICPYCHRKDLDILFNHLLNHYGVKKVISKFEISERNLHVVYVDKTEENYKICFDGNMSFLVHTSDNAHIFKKLSITNPSGFMKNMGFSSGFGGHFPFCSEMGLRCFLDFVQENFVISDGVPDEASVSYEINITTCSEYEWIFDN